MDDVDQTSIPQSGKEKISIFTAITLIINVGALVWGAAQISATVNNLSHTIGRLESSVETIQRSTQQNRIDIELLRSYQDRERELARPRR